MRARPPTQAGIQFAIVKPPSSEVVSTVEQIFKWGSLNSKIADWDYFTVRCWLAAVILVAVLLAN